MIAKILRFCMIAGCLGLAGCKDEVYRGLTARDANEMTALLIAQGIEAGRTTAADGTYSIQVDQKDFSRTITLLSANGYPKESFRSMGEIFPGDGFIVTPLEQRARLNFALNQELSRTVSMIDGVVRSRVHVVVPEVDYRVPNAPRPTASVAVYHIPTVSSDDLASKVRLIVANGVQGLNYRDVSIATFVATGTSAATPSAKATGIGFGTVDTPAIPWNAILWAVSLLAAAAAVFYVLRGNRQKA